MEQTIINQKFNHTFNPSETVEYISNLLVC